MQDTHNDRSQVYLKLVDHFVNDEQDFRSYVVKEYDAHQEASMKSHGEALKDIVRRVS